MCMRVRAAVVKFRVKKKYILVRKDAHAAGWVRGECRCRE